MQRERKIGVLRRFVVGLAVAAIVAPAAQARVDELGGGAEGSTARTAVIKGDDKAIVSGNDGSAILIGDDKVIVPWTGDSTVLIHGDDKVFAPQGGDSTVLVHGDDKVIAPQPGDYTLAGYRRALPQDYGDPTSIPVGGLTSPGTFDWGDAFVGAGVAFALMLLAGGAALGTRRRDRPAAA